MNALARLEQRTLRRIDARSEQGLRRQRLSLLPGACAPHVTLDGRGLLNFASNDYLGLSRHPDVTAALAEAPAGSSASALVCGYSPWHQRLEETVAQLLGSPAALLFPSGYAANIGLLTALLDRHDWAFHDRYNHASLLDATRLAGARLQRYAHADPPALGTLLARLPADGVGVAVTEGVFSMDGDIAPLPQLLAQCHGRIPLILDDAHAFGVIGERGQGSLAHWQLPPGAVLARVVTFGKALGVAGACVVGPGWLVDALLQFARTYIYTTALPPCLCAALLAALGVMDRESWRRDRLQERIGQFRRGAADLGLPVGPSATAIQPLLIGAAQQALEAAQRLQHAGLLVTAFRPPTVPQGTARLRICLSAAHEPQHIDALLRALADLQRRGML